MRERENFLEPKPKPFMLYDNAVYLQARSTWINRILRRLYRSRCLYASKSTSLNIVVRFVRSFSFFSSHSYLNPFCLSYFVGTCSYDVLIKWKSFCCWAWNFCCLTNTHPYINPKDCNKINMRCTAIENKWKENDKFPCRVHQFAS